MQCFSFRVVFSQDLPSNGSLQGGEIIQLSVNGGIWSSVAKHFKKQHNNVDLYDTFSKSTPCSSTTESHTKSWSFHSNPFGSF